MIAEMLETSDQVRLYLQIDPVDDPKAVVIFTPICSMRFLMNLSKGKSWTMCFFG